MSNFGFEVWLLYHISAEIPAEYNTADKVKKAVLAQMDQGFTIDKFAILIREAANNAYVADPFNADLCPSTRVSKVYNLATTVLDILGSVKMYNF